MGAEIAVVLAGVERRLVRELEERRAFSSSTAVPLDPGHVVRRRRLDRLVRAGVVREARPGHYWLESAVWEAYVARRRLVALSALGLMLIGLLLLWYLGTRA